MMDIELRYVPIAEDYMPNMKKMRSKIDKNTIMLVASAPQYPQGMYYVVMFNVTRNRCFVVFFCQVK